MFSGASAFDQVLCWDVPIHTDHVDDDVINDESFGGGFDSGIGDMFNDSPGRLCDDRDHELERMKSEIAELRAIVENLQGFVEGDIRDALHAKKKWEKAMVNREAAEQMLGKYKKGSKQHEVGSFGVS